MLVQIRYSGDLEAPCVRRAASIDSFAQPHEVVRPRRMALTFTAFVRPQAQRQMTFRLGPPGPATSAMTVRHPYTSPMRFKRCTWKE